MPTEGTHIKFKNYQNQVPVPYVIYANFESIIKPKMDKAGDKSEITSEQEACGFGYQVVRYNGQAEEPVIYRGKNVIEAFLCHLECVVSNINNIFAHPKTTNHVWTKNQSDYNQATQCWIHEQKNNHPQSKNPLSLHRHKSCNNKLELKSGKTKIPVVFHNLKGYDSHLIMQKIHKAKSSITCIPNNAEKYISFSVAQLKFLDSFQFMASSLEKLVAATDKSDFRLLNCLHMIFLHCILRYLIIL